MPLRRSPLLTPSALRARRLNALRYGWDALNLRDKTKDVVGTKLEFRLNSATCPEELAPGGDRDWTADRPPGRGVERSKDVVGMKLESRLNSATCPEEFGIAIGSASSGRRVVLASMEEPR